MDMKIIKCEKRICSCCMEEHEVKTVLVMEHATFKKCTVDYEKTNHNSQLLISVEYGQSME